MSLKYINYLLDDAAIKKILAIEKEQGWPFRRLNMLHHLL